MAGRTPVKARARTPATATPRSTPRRKRRCGPCASRNEPQCTFQEGCARAVTPRITRSAGLLKEGLAQDAGNSKSGSPDKDDGIMPPFKEDQIMILAPGSYTTLAQLGLPESFTPAQLRIKSRMFPADQDGEWEPFKVRQKPKPSKPVAASEVDPPPIGGDSNVEPDLYEDWDTDEGAVWPIAGGKITNWSCFFALLNYVYNKLSPHMHIQTPILMIAQPCWSERDHEQITQFFFEKFRCPAFSLVDAATAALYGFNVENACIIDVGLNKADITAISGFEISRVGRTVALPKCGGESMTQSLIKRLESKRFSRDMCEQLKSNVICEILPAGVPLPGANSTSGEDITNPASAASTGATGSGPGHRKTAGAMGDVPLGPGPDTQVGDEADGDTEGVLDVASIVTAGEKKMEEFLAKKDKEKAEKASKKKGTAADPKAKDASKESKLPNSRREKTTFSYHDASMTSILKDMTIEDDKPADQPGAEPATGGNEGTVQPVEPMPSAPPTSAKPSSRREVEVGIERFMAAADGQLERLADAIHRTISSLDVAKRADVWDSLILVGNGSKVRGFREALMTIIQQKYIISPSSATIFTSEIPSNISTPAGTGAQTPQAVPTNSAPNGPTGTGVAGGGGGGVNPLLLAATTASNSALIAQSQQAAAAGSNLPPHLQHLQQQQQQQQHTVHSSHAQTPTSAKWAKNMEYFPEWKEHGYEEAAFLGAQVAARIFFTSPPGDFKTYLSRSDYNELGPGGVHQVYI